MDTVKLSLGSHTIGAMPNAGEQIRDAQGRVLTGFDHNRERIARELRAHLSANPLMRADAGSLALEEDLRHRKARFWETPERPLVAETFVPFDPEAASFADVDKYLWEKRTTLGEAKLHQALNGITSAPDVSEYAEFQEEEIINAIISYGWNVQDEMVGARINYNFGTRRAELARRAIRRTFDRVLLNGATVGAKVFRGLFTLDTAAPGKGAVTPVSGLTGAWYTFPAGGTTLNQILADFKLIWDSYLNAVYKATGSDEDVPDTFAMSDRMESFLRHTSIDATNRTTLLDDLKAKYPEIKNWLVHRDLRDVTASKDRNILYRKDPMVVAAAVPVTYQERPMIQEPFSQRIYAYGRVAPLVLHDARLIQYADIAMHA